MNSSLDKIKSAVLLAIDAMRVNILRTLLAILGVTIGISSIIIVFSAGEGIQGILQAQSESFGTDALQIEIKVPSSKKGVAGEQQSATSLIQGAQVTTMKHDDLEDILRLPNVTQGYGLLMTQLPVTYRDETERPQIWASSASFIDIDEAEVEEGRFFSDAEDRSLAQVAVLGKDIKEDLFGESDPLGRTIKLGNTRFEVIGVMEERGSFFGFNFDSFIYLPVKTLQKKVMGVDYIISILVQLEDIQYADETAETIRAIMRENHDIDPPDEIREGIFDTGQDDFRVVSMVEAVEVFGDVSLTLTIVLLAIVAISLVVGGVGVMNMMYVIVNERTPEIGLRKAVGATYQDIMLQFLMESIAITLAGGIIGSIIGVAVSYGIALAAQSVGYPWELQVPFVAFLTAAIFSIIFGIFFGVYPARKAAQLDPIEAMRHE